MSITRLCVELKLLPRLLVDVRRPQHGPPPRLGGQRDGSRHLRPGLLGGPHDVGGGRVDDGVVEGFQANPDTAGHEVFRSDV
jgi:hypothetical protein